MAASAETAARRPARRVLLALVALVVAVAAYMSAFSAGAQSTGTLVTAGGKHAITVEVADTPEAREVGLMNRASMPADHGMLFDFVESREVTMWMKNTYIPLDMLFMDETGTITHIAANTQPLSLAVIASRGPARYVLELNGGAAARLGVKAGDRLEHAAIGAT